MPIRQKDLLADIVRNKRPYLLLAPVGMGKSVLLESFARQMIEAAKLAITTHSLPDSLRIPLLVRLRNFNSLNAQEIGIKDLLDQAESKVFPGETTPVLLSGDISFLAKTGVLFPLFDGFDELVYRESFCERLHDALNSPDLLRNCSCVLTSRTDADVGVIPIGKEFRCTIDPLTEAEIREYITDRRGLAIETLDSAPVAIRRLLSQPLYLCIWCNCLTLDQAPFTLSDLMEEMFVDYLERRGVVRFRKDCVGDGTAQEDRKNKIAVLHDLFSRVCFQLAKDGFGSRLRFSELLELTDIERQRLGEVIRLTGIIQRIPKATGDDELYVDPVPLVEHLVGWQLAKTFRGDAQPSSRIGSLQVIRKWVWQPRMHDVLDHCFDALWNSGEPGQEQGARALVQWLTDVSNKDSLSRPASGGAEGVVANCADDLIRPFCLTALRLINLNRKLQADDTTLTNVISAVVWLFHRESISIAPYHDHLASTARSLGRLAFRKMLEEYISAVARTPDVGIKNRLELEISVAIWDVPENLALDCVRKILVLISNPKNADIRERLGDAIASRADMRLAGRLPEASALGCVKEWLQAVRDPKNFNLREQLTCAIKGAAGRLPEASALACIKEWFQAAREPKNFDIKEQLVAAVNGATSRVPKAYAFDCIKEFLGATWNPQNIDIKYQLARDALLVATELVPEDSVLACIKELIRIFHDPQYSDIDSWITKAMRKATGHVPEASALECVRELLQAARDLGHHDNFGHDRLDDAIGGAAKRVPESLALDCIKAWLQEFNDPQNRYINHQISVAICGVAERVPEASALDCVREWLQSARNPHTTDLARYHLDSAIQGATKRIPNGSAFVCVMELVRAICDPQIADIRSKLTFSAIVNAGGHLPEASALDCVRELLLVIRDPQNKDIKDELADVIRGAARRVPEASALICVTELLEFTRELHGDRIENRLTDAISGAAERLPEALALDSAREWLQAIHHSRNANIEYQLTCAIRAAATRVPEASALDFMREWRQAAQDPKNADIKKTLEYSLGITTHKIPPRQRLEAAQWALNEGDEELAFRIAAEGTEVAIFSAWGRKPNDPSGQRNIIFHVKWREETELAVDSDAVPEEIKRFFWVGPTVAPGPVTEDRLVDRDEPSQAVLVKASKQGGKIESMDDPASSPMRYVFRQVFQGTWEIAFNSAVQQRDCDLEGFEYISRLLEVPNNRISNLFLQTGSEKLARALARQINDSVMDQAAKIKVLERIQRLGNDENSLDSAKAAEATIELDKLRLILRKSYKLGSRKAPVRNSELVKAQKSVKKNLNKAYDWLESHGFAALANHLKERIKPDDYAQVYRPSETPPHWEVTLLNPRDLVPPGK